MNIIIVDENDNPVGVRARGERGRGAPSGIYRVASLWLTNSRGEILLAQRALTKNDPGKWVPPVNGTVEEGETYESNILKEIVEELGVTDLHPKPAHKFFRVELDRRYFVQFFEDVTDKAIADFYPDPYEIMGLRWWTEEELRTAVREHPENFVTYIVDKYGAEPSVLATNAMASSDNDVPRAIVRSAARLSPNP